MSRKAKVLLGGLLVCGTLALQPGDVIAEANSGSQESRTATQTAKSGDAYYIVKPGDTFYRIAIKYGLNLNTLRKLNPEIRNINQIYPGQKIRVREEAPTPSPSPAPQQPNRQQPSPVSDKAQRVVNLAYRLLGKKYRHGATGPNEFDCSGFTQYVYKHAAGIHLPRTSSAQAKVGTPVSLSNLKHGDIIYFGKGISHVGIYVGDGYMISAQSSKTGVKKAYIMSGYWRQHFVNGRRVLK